MSKELLNEYYQGVNRLDEKLKDLTEEIINFRPAREDAWTIKEHLIHLVDSELNGFIRLKSIIAQPGSTCYVMDEDLWTRNIRRKHEDLGKYLAVFRLIRALGFDLLADEDEKNWQKDYFIRHYRGKTDEVTIEKCLQFYINHLNFHLDYVERIKSQFYL